MAHKTDFTDNPLCGEASIDRSRISLPGPVIFFSACICLLAFTGIFSLFPLTSPTTSQEALPQATASKITAPKPGGLHPSIKGSVIQVTEILRVIDGDTVEARISPWPDLSITAKIRLRGIDTPETFRAKCELEKNKGFKAKTYVTDQLARAKKVKLSHIKKGKYAGRVVAHIWLFSDTGWVNLADRLKAQNLAAPYSGKKRRNWCA